MAKIQATPNQIRDLVSSAEARFTKLVEATGNRMVFQQEALFAMQSMLANEYLASCALNNPISFKLAMAQIATAGLTLNPSMGLAYLVPRDGKVIADISYRGLMKIATDSRAVNLIVAEAVYSHDRFIYRGSNSEPVHDFDPFLAKADRGEFRGVYVKAYLAMGTLLVRAVSAEEVYASRDLSSAWVRGKVGNKGPWETHFLPMALKSAVKVARKFWPMTSPVLENIISYLNEDGGEGFSSGPVTLGVAAREMGVAQIGAEEVIPMPQMSIDPRTEMALNGEAEIPVEIVHPQVAEQQAASRPEGRAQQRKPSAPQNVQQDDSEVDPKVIERIDSVVSRCVRLNSFEAGLDWVASNLTGASYNLAMNRFDEARKNVKAA